MKQIPCSEDSNKVSFVDDPEAIACLLEELMHVARESERVRFKSIYDVAVSLGYRGDHYRYSVFSSRMATCVNLKRVWTSVSLRKISTASMNFSSETHAFWVHHYFQKLSVSLASQQMVERGPLWIRYIRASFTCFRNS